jgi:hypothetical protein
MPTEDEDEDEEGKKKKNNTNRKYKIQQEQQNTLIISFNQAKPISQLTAHCCYLQ